MSVSGASDAFVVPSLREWYEKLDESHKEQFRIAFHGNGGATDSTIQPSSFTTPASLTPQSNPIKSLDQSLLKSVTAMSLPVDTITTGHEGNQLEAGEAKKSQKLPFLHGLNNGSEKPPRSSKNDSVPKIEPATQDSPSDRDTRLIPIYGGGSSRSAITQPGTTASRPIGKPVANTSVFTDDRRQTTTGTKVPLSLKRGNLGGLGNPLVKKPTLPTNFPNSGGTSIPIPEAFALPNWYKELHITQRSTYSRDILARLDQIRARIAKCAAPGTTQEIRDAQFMLIREDLHVYEYLEVDEILVKKSKLLEYNIGLSQLFGPNAEGIRYPYDIAADAEALYNKWRRHDFDPDMLRGIDHRKKKGKGDRARLASALIPDYPNRISPNVFGANDLVNGQWWPMLLAALRDGAHGAAQAGIHGAAGKGAYSILVSGSHYNDRDDGDILRYCGTEGENGEPTDHTKRMLESVNLGQPVRVLRTSKIPDPNQYKPKLGYRYDGLYDVKSFEILDPNKAHYRFLLERCEGQQPIRCKGVYARPSSQDKEAYQNNRDLMG